MSLQAHARVDEKHFEKSLAKFFSNTVGEFRKLFSSVWIAFIFGKLAEFSILKLSLVITEAVCCDSFESLCNVRKAKIVRLVERKLVSTGLYCACASAVPFIKTLDRVNQPQKLGSKDQSINDPRNMQYLLDKTFFWSSCLSKEARAHKPPYTATLLGEIIWNITIKTNIKQNELLSTKSLMKLAQSNETCRIIKRFTIQVCSVPLTSLAFLIFFLIFNRTHR